MKITVTSYINGEFRELYSLNERYYYGGQILHECFDGFATRIVLATTVNNYYRGQLILNINGEEHKNQIVQLFPNCYFFNYISYCAEVTHILNDCPPDMECT